ncbi:spore coat protein CotJB [Clostridiaceae bacterium M8S5]|nr:spore coat protein CotJB [Clostridiaceae bacterium M8S5]
MNTCQKEDLKRLMEIDFSLLEMNLFLDTHPNDKDAIELHNSLTQKCMHLRYNYVCKYGPLSNEDMSPCPYQYISSPWPWEINFSRR